MQANLLEQAALGAVLLYPQTITSLRALLDPEHFADSTHALCWRILGEFDDEGIVPDAITIADAFTRRVRGAARCLSALEIEGFRTFAPSMPEAAEGVARRLVAQAHVRKLRTAALTIEKRASDPTVNIAQLMLDAPKLIEEATTRREERPAATSVQLAEECWQELEELRKHGRPRGFSTGLTEVDAYARLKPGEQWVLAGRPAMGKSAFAGKLLRSVAEQGQPALFFSLEMPRKMVFFRLACELAGINNRVLENGELTEEHQQALARAFDDLSRLPFEVDDTAGITLFDLKSKAQRARQRLGSLGVVIVDYLQLMRASRSSKSDNREQEISEISRGGKELAKELRTTLVLLSQLNRKCEERADKRPLLSDLRESGSIEQDADVVLFLYRDEYYNKDSSDIGIAEVMCVKQRSGATGTARVGFEKHLTRFHDLDTGNVTRLPQRSPSRPRRQYDHAAGDDE